MPYLVMCLDKPGAVSTRNATRALHIEYLLEKFDIIEFAGPMSTDDNAFGVGSLYILNVEERAAAEAFVAAEPYNKADIFESITIHRWRKAIPEFSAGALRKELEMAKATDGRG